MIEEKIKMDFPNDLRYTKDHEWAKIEGDVATIGITDYAQGELGDIVFVELPEVGRKATFGQPFGTVEAVKAVSDLYAPLSGEIIEVNTKIKDAPDLVNREPYNSGWMIKIKLSNPSEVNQLMSADDYKKMIGK
jgi:glycine cleavage system H protein